jgi:tRNA-2-methylthio-N6-dimethylallyladenosine synthase
MIENTPETNKKTGTQIPARFLARDPEKLKAERAAREKELEKRELAESARQEEFLQQAKMYVKELSMELGRTPTYHVTNFGCQMNARDAEKLSGVLESAGFTEIDDESADFVIYNTCTVRDNADQHFYGRLGRASHCKKTNPYMKIAVCGCMMQEKTNVDKLKKSYPYVDLIFGTHNIFRFPEYLCKVYENAQRYPSSQSARRVVDVWESTDLIVEDLPVERKFRYKSGINIMFGCNNFCSYCIVPYVRGRERSREPKDILNEIEKMVADGVVEVMLLGQNVNSYGKDLPEPVTFAQLLDEIAQIPGLRRIRFMTPHPKDISEELIQVIRRHPNIARHIHFPMQSGSTRILRLMNRRYTKEQYLERALYIRKELPDAAITTDIIAGFPGETPADVDDTIDVIRKVHFDNAYTFIYSKRHGTPAAEMEQVPEEQVKEGFDRILHEVQESAKEQTAKLQGKVMTALAEEENRQMEGYITGRLSNNTIVHFPGDASMIGRFFDVSLDECKGFYYFGSVVRENPRGY